MIGDEVRGRGFGEPRKREDERERKAMQAGSELSGWLGRALRLIVQGWGGWYDGDAVETKHTAW